MKPIKMGTAPAERRADQRKAKNNRE